MPQQPDTLHPMQPLSPAEFIGGDSPVVPAAGQSLLQALAANDDDPRQLWPGDVYDMVMGRRKIAYRIYPSLLDKFQSLLDYEDEAEKPWNIVSDKAAAEGRYPGKVAGDYILTPDELYARTERELIDSINRVPREPSEAADRGTALNEIVDCILLHKPCTRSDMSITSERVNGTPIAVRAEINGFSFTFDITLVNALRDFFRGSCCQYFISAPLPTRFGDVLLYGYMDYWRADHITDLKTTSNYTFGNYQNRWQRWVYPYCAIASGLTDSVADFTYLVVALRKDRVSHFITGDIYPEVYSYRHDQALPHLTQIVEAFISWLESPKIRQQITNKKIFNDLTTD